MRGELARANGGRARLAREAEPATPAGRVAEVFADGACLGNPGPGGYGVLVRVPGQPERELSGGDPSTTNNQMELTGAIVGLEAALGLEAGEIVVRSDSEYLVKGMTAWLPGWERRGWVTAAGTPVKNRELWERLRNLCQGRRVRWEWVRGHVGHPENERCDALAQAAAQAVAARAAPRRGR